MGGRGWERWDPGLRCANPAHGLHGQGCSWARYRAVTALRGSSKGHPCTDAAERGGGLALAWAPVGDAEHLPGTLRWGLAMLERPLLPLFPRRCLQADGGLFWGAYVSYCVRGGGCHVPSPPLGSCPSVTSICPALPLAVQHLPGGDSL